MTRSLKFSRPGPHEDVNIIIDKLIKYAADKWTVK